MCNGQEVCEPQTGCVAGSPLACDDDNPCNGQETCSPVSGCVAGQPVSCSDGNPCNGQESCDADSGCVSGAPLGCDDGNVCNGFEACLTDVGCINGAPLDCDDNDPCNGIELCGETSGCYAGPALKCGDGNLCNGIETCLSGVGCVPGIPAACDDKNACNGAESCVAETGCQAGVALSCDDGNVCNGTETCDQQSGCVAGTPQLCNDGDACNGIETCDASNGCVSSGPPSCDDGDPCNGLEGCDKDKGCIVVGQLDCDDGNDCTADSCGAGGCLHENLAVPCSDGELCTHGDSCVGGVCTGTGYGCEDGLPCTTDLCDGSGGCIATPLPGFCAIDEQCIPDGTVNPLNGCEECVALANDSQWLPRLAACELPGAEAATCFGGTCVVEACAGSMADCNDKPEDGCEIDTALDPAHCGECDGACELPGAETYLCDAGICSVASCASTHYDLNGDLADGCEAPLVWVDGASEVETETGEVASPYKTIQAALDATEGPAAIRVLPFTYKESVVASKPDILILGNGNTTVIAGAPDSTVVKLSASNITLQKVRVTGGRLGVQAAGSAATPSTGLVLRDVTIDGIAATVGFAGGIYASNTPGILIEDVTVTGVTSAAFDIAGTCADPSVSGTTCELGAAPGAFAVQLANAPAFVVKNAVISAVVGGKGGAVNKPKQGRGGRGGSATGIYASKSDGGEVTGAVIKNIKGGAGGAGWIGGGRGGQGSGILLASSADISLGANTIKTIAGGAPTGLGNHGPAYAVTLSNAASTQIALDNTANGTPIVYLYGVDGVTVSGLNLTGSLAPTNYGVMAAVASKNVTFSGNTVKGPTSLTSGAAVGLSGAAGLARTGIYLSACEGCKVTGNAVSNIAGGTGEPGQLTGAGGSAYGIFVSSSPNAAVEQNTVSALTGGAAGTSKIAFANPPISYANGGWLYGIEVRTSDGAVVAHNRVETLAGGLHNNQANASPGRPRGILIRDQVGGAVHHNQVLFHSGGTPAGIYVTNAQGVGFWNCSIHSMGSGYGVYVDDKQTTPLVMDGFAVTTANAGCFGSHSSNPASLLSIDYSTGYCGSKWVVNATELAHNNITINIFAAPGAGDLHLLPNIWGVNKGDPTRDCSDEPAPNGCRINMGAFGGTSEATSNPGATHCVVCPPP